MSASIQASRPEKSVKDMNQGDTDSESLLECFKKLYREMSADDLKHELINTVYAENLEFIDSFHHLHGRTAFVEYCEQLYENLRACDFEFHDQWCQPGKAMLTWTMTYVHPRLNRAKPIKVNGATELHFTDKIYFHQDYCDGGALLYEHVPVLGSVIYQLKKRLV